MKRKAEQRTFAHVHAAVLIVMSVPVSAIAAAEMPKITSGVCRRPAVTDFKVVCDRWPDGTDLRQFGLDAIRIENAKTEEDKALAVWRWMRRCTMRTNGRAPRERGRWVDASKILSVYGAHHCGGLSLLLTDIWRSLGYRARRLYRHGHTLADLHYTDKDGVARFHTFDTNYGWFVYTRDGSRIAHAEDIGADFSLYDHPSRTHVPWIDKKMWMWGWCHMPQMALPGPRTIDLRPGEGVTRLWRNVGKPHHNNVGVRPWDEKDQPPYKREFGNGLFTWLADFGPNWRDSLAAEPVNATVIDGELAQTDPKKPTEVIYRVMLPNIVADGQVLLNAAGNVIVETDRGKTWRAVKPDAFYTAQALTKTNGGPPGRYAYLLRLRLNGGATVAQFAVANIVQLNPRSLPALLPGENTITVHGNLAEGYALQVIYLWDDPTGKDRTHSAFLHRMPATYTIWTAGKDWKDVTCKKIIARIKPVAAGNEHIGESRPPAVRPDGPLPQADVRTIIGPKKAPKAKVVSAWITDLKSKDPEVRRVAAAALSAQREAKAWDALAAVALEDTTQAKMHAIQALFWTDRKKAVPVLRKILTKDGSVKFAEKDSEFGSPTHGNCVGTIAAMSGLTGFKEFVPELNQLAWKTTTNARWGILRALGRINDPRGYPAIRRFCRSGSHDTGTISCEAAGRIGDKEALENAARWLRSKRYPIRTLKAIEALGKAGVAGHTDKIIEHIKLRSYSEDWRAVASTALARTGEPARCIPVIEELLAKEKWPWVRRKMEAALGQLRRRSQE